LACGEIARYHRETRLIHQDGGSFWGDLLVAPVRSSSAGMPTESFVAIVADITERKYTEEQALRQQQALAALRERERMARELHDTTAQVLGYVNVQTQTVRELLATGQVAAATTALRDLAHAAHDAHTDVRAFIVGVSTNTKLTIGPSPARCFRTALAQLVEQFTSLADIPAELIAPPDLALSQLPATIELQVLRIMQEALNNVRKHADATHVRVTVAIAHQELCVTVRDDGNGFVLPGIGSTGSARYGLRSMRERAAEIEAELHISSASEAGTTICLRVPLQQARAPQEQTILLVDDHALFREGLRNLLATRGLQVIGTASNGREAIAQARALRPSVVLMDMEMPEIDGLSALQQIMAELPDTHVVMLTASADDARLLEVVRNGAAGYLLKAQCAEEIFSMLAALARGEVPLAPELVARMMQRMARQAEPVPAATPALVSTSAGDTALNPRQGELLSLLARGRTYKEIGAEMAISEHTVRYHVQEIMSRLNLGSRAELIAYAARRFQPV
jgi:DNA-binding NarL/FixJ family response regulator/signal transduction histidine kinase